MNAVFHLCYSANNQRFERVYGAFSVSKPKSLFNHQRISENEKGCITYFRRLVGLLEGGAVSLLVCWDAKSFLLALIARWYQRAATKIVWSVHDERRVARGFAQEGALRLSRRLMRRASCVVFRSIAAEQLNRGSLNRAMAVRVIEDGFDTSMFSPLESQKARFRAERAIDGRSLIVGVLSRDCLGSQGELVAEAFRGLCAEQPLAKLLIGGDRGVRDTFDRLAEFQRMGISPDALSVLERGEENVDFYRSVDIFMTMSSDDATLDALIEAQLCGVPCVAPESPQTREIIDPFGVMFSTKDSGSLKGGLRYLGSCSAEERGALGVSAREAMIERFSAQQMRTRYEALFLEMVDPAPLTIVANS